MGPQAKKEVEKAGELAAMGLVAMCSRGCCASVICLSEIGELLGGILNSLPDWQSRKTKKASL
jgi:hypothetical protein